MNVYEKLIAARLYFLNQGVKKSGHNAYTNFDYFELGDILPTVNRAAKELGFVCVVRFSETEATLDFVNIEKPDEKIIFTSPMSTADLKNNHAVQNLGAVETYIRRYLYLTAFEIVESDCLDATQGAKDNKQGSLPENVGFSALKKSDDATSVSGQMAAVLAQTFPETDERVFDKADADNFKAMWQEKGAEAALIAAKREASMRIEARRARDK